ncbi:MAG: sulfurtransferase TusA family protein [Nitrospinae bacterium]|nr:sulfurtransferase TusA family protein [Nitrospinota bacterium]
MKHFLDITKDHCPMTFVKTKLKLNQLEKGDLLEVLLMEGEPLKNIEKSSLEQGYKLLSVNGEGNGVFRVLVEK